MANRIVSFLLFQIFEANNNRYKEKKNILQSGVVAKYVTLWPTQWHEQLCFRMEIYGKAYLERGTIMINVCKLYTPVILVFVLVCYKL